MRTPGCRRCPLSGISGGTAGEVQSLTVTATSNNTGLIPNPTVTYTSPDATGSLSYTPVANQDGTAIITVTVNDNGGGTESVQQTFTVNVTAVNDPPTLAAIANPPAINGGRRAADGDLSVASAAAPPASRSR